ncbi:conserved Plasmodium protein, unknown function [Plasmodium relictum]|uniref:Uncharacterized protein n=1 Tax=Plasmodium relictum TaxID=85471 RepID=A0A1J1H630_PLARL|nr:conserved Plasmodium protein, unknown function [Plasmodium relictum]CRH00390.1 conserved Plasmodium protein, unknown function [Plasmodium relictum]
MNKTCEFNKNDKKIYFRRNSREFNGSNESTETCFQEELCNDDGTVIINVEIEKKDGDTNYLSENNLKELKDISGESQCTNEEFIYNCFCNINKLSIKCVLRFFADCFSFICAVCIWGILDDIFILMAKDNIHAKLYYYLIFTVIFATITCSFNFYFSKCASKNNFIYDDVESKV